MDSYESKHPDISAATLEKLLGTTREFFIDNQFYKSIYYGEIKTTVLYRGDVNKIFRFKDDNDTIYWIDAAIDTLSIVSESRLEETEDTILGLKCQKLTVVTNTGIVTYYFNNEYALLPRAFSRHRLECWDFYTATAKALPLKIVFETPEMTVTSTATKIERMKLPIETFKIPNGHLKML